jgi:gliding motility-associated-like protein
LQKRIIFLVTSLAILLLQPLYGQKEGAIWYFGNHAGLDFNLQYPRPLTDGMINTREGVATICNANGELLFYTDGQTVYDKTHSVMQNGSGLYGDMSSTQSSIIVPKPGSTTLYYIFTVDQAGIPSEPGNGLNYSIVDMALNGGKGSVIEKNTPMPNTSGVHFTEKITVVKHKNGTDYWILAHQFDTWVFYEFLLTSTTLKLHATIGEGSEHNFDPDDRINRGATGYLKSSPKGDYLVAAIEGLHIFELFKFDNSNGAISLVAKLPAGTLAQPMSAIGAAYGVEFSPTGNFLYGSTRQGGIIYQWDISTPDQAKILSSMQILRENSSVLCGAMQLAFNGKIYVSLGGQPWLGVVNSPIQKQCNYIEAGASLVNNAGDTVLGGKAFFGLPTFLSDFFKSAEFYFENTCYLDKTIFYPSTRIGVDEPPIWTVKTKAGVPVGNFSADPDTWQGTFTFPAPGVYIVTMRVSQFGSPFTYDREVTINELPDLNFPDVTSLCEGSVARLDAGEGAFYLWKDNPNLSVERYREISRGGTFIVTVTHYNGCSNSDTTQVVATPKPVIADTLISFAACGSSNGSITLVMEKALDKYTFAWKGHPENTTNQITNMPLGLYEVKITDTDTGCVLTSTLSISEEDAPQVEVQSSVSGAVCRGTSITLTARGAADYLWSYPEGLTTSTIVIAPLETTTYYVEGSTTDAVTGAVCTSVGEITITVHPYTLPQLGADRLNNCFGETVRLDGGADYQKWEWSNGMNSREIAITQSEPGLILFATDANLCVLSDTINIIVKPLPEIQLGDDLIECKGAPIELSGGTGDSYQWSTSEVTQSIFVNESGLYKLTIQTNGCSNTDSISVTIKPLPEVNLGNDTTACVSEPLELDGGKGDSWLWSTSEETEKITVTQSGTYWVETSLDGCSVRDEIVLVIKPLPVVNLGRDTIICQSDPLELSGGTGDEYIWSTGDFTPTIRVSQTNTYRLTISKDGCLNSDTVQVKVNDPALLSIKDVTINPVTCPGTRDGSLIILAEGSGNDFEYSIDDGVNWFDSPIFSGLYGNNNFKILVREDQACIARYFKEVTFVEPDSIRLRARMISPSCETCPDGEIHLNISGGTSPYSILWSTNDTVAHLMDLVMGKYLVWVTDANRCRTSTLVDLNLDYPPFQVPNAFTPNGDGYNETWAIPSLIDFPECEIKIFNRLGKMVWWSDLGYPVPWNGIDKSGEVLPMGAYYYLLWLDRTTKPLKGSVSILR